MNKYLLDLKKKQHFAKMIKAHLYRDRIPSAASLTVESSLVLPVFIFAVLTFVYIGLIIRTQD